MNKPYQAIMLAAVIVTLSFTGGCASNKNLPMKVQSDPLGAYVVYQKHTTSSNDGKDWIYLGKTPLNIQQSIGDGNLKNNESLRLRVMKDGYSDQVRDWSGKDIEADIDQMGHLFWNPRLVPGNQ
jgi:hypothetical protein